MRQFETGATRDTEEGKLDYEGFLSPLVLKRYAEYMHEHRIQADGNLRSSDNWQKGIPKDVYMKSAWRHFMDWWVSHRDEGCDQEAVCALLFNVMGYLHEELIRKGPKTTTISVSESGRCVDYSSKLGRMEADMKSVLSRQNTGLRGFND